VTDSERRLQRLLELVAREEEHLLGVIDRLFPAADEAQLSTSWLAGILATPEGIDRLESFVGKFSRMQDTMMDKLLPAFLEAVGERTGTALDNLNRAQRLGLVTDPDQWLGMRLLRNRLVHEYVEDPAELAGALTKARTLAGELSKTYRSIRAYAARHLAGSA
jgi:uncharacterized protein with HEPN domain